MLAHQGESVGQLPQTATLNATLFATHVATSARWWIRGILPSGRVDRRRGTGDSAARRSPRFAHEGGCNWPPHVGSKSGASLPEPSQAMLEAPGGPGRFLFGCVAHIRFLADFAILPSETGRSGLAGRLHALRWARKGLQGLGETAFPCAGPQKRLLARAGGASVGLGAVGQLVLGASPCPAIGGQRAPAHTRRGY